MIMATYTKINDPVNRAKLLPYLQAVVSKKNFLTKDDLEDIAEDLNLPIADVYGTASFFSFLETERQLGQFVIRVCQTIVCDMHGKEEIIETMEHCLGIKLGETTADKKFSLLTTNCLGFCHKGPAMLINDDVYTELTPDKVRAIIKDYKLNK
jgi:NADH:ubiquinone oxidoreductase subunit E